MSDIKVGDCVEVTHAEGLDLVYYTVGAGGRVVKELMGLYTVQFTYGKYKTLDGGRWAVNAAQVKVVTPYSSTFTKPAEPKPTTGHVANGGGLQKHSVGDIYPLAVVGYANGDHVRFTVENLETGCVAACGKVVRAWPNVTGALAFAKRFKQDKCVGLDVVTWSTERPIFEGSMLVFPSTERFVLA